jgi:hypothetical protein
MELMKYKTKRDIWIALLLLLTGLIFGYFIGKYNYDFSLGNHHESLDFVKSMGSYNHNQNKISMPPINIQERIQNIESNFTVTLRSCLGPECYDSRPGK